VRRSLTFVVSLAVTLALLWAGLAAGRAEAAVFNYCNPSPSGWDLIAATGVASDGHRYSQYARTCLVYDNGPDTWKVQTSTQNRRDGSVYSATVNNGDTVAAVVFVRIPGGSWQEVIRRGPGYWSDNPGTGPTFTSPQYSHPRDFRHDILGSTYNLRVCWTASICSSSHNHNSPIVGEV
jgi:hypothetical protein